jgi:ribosomal protein L3 glutamine methyltransferase
MNSDQELHGVWLEAATTLNTVADWVRFAVTSMEESGVFFGHGSDNAHDEAVYLVQKALRLPVEHIEPYYTAKLLTHENKKLGYWLKRRVEDRIPTAYLAHEAWLQGQPFYVDERVIIPRSFIAELLAEELSPWIADPEGVETVLDVCTGSGCLAILAAQTFPNALVDGVDISEEALEVANINNRSYQLEERVRFLHSDLLSSNKIGTYDLILCNPPYVNSESMRRLPKEFLAEPQIALAGGNDGMDLIRKLLKNAKRHLNPGGYLVVELGNEKVFFEAAFPQLAVAWLSVSAGDSQVFLIEHDLLPDDL